MWKFNRRVGIPLVIGGKKIKQILLPKHAFSLQNTLVIILLITNMHNIFTTPKQNAKQLDSVAFEHMLNTCWAKLSQIFKRFIPKTNWSTMPRQKYPQQFSTLKFLDLQFSWRHAWKQSLIDVLLTNPCHRFLCKRLELKWLRKKEEGLY